MAYRSSREAILAAFVRLENRTASRVFKLEQIVREVRLHSDQFSESAIKAQVTRMCRNAPGSLYDDLERVIHGHYHRLV